MIFYNIYLMNNLYSTVSTVKKEIITKEKKVNGIEIDNTLKAPICCIVGHVDAGKTSLLDKLRNTNIQEKEVGGITQHIGSTFFPIETIKNSCSSIKGKFEVICNIPGILMIDTPGHSEFQSLRDVGTSICDLGILIIDIEESIQEQTKEAIKLLKEKKIPFVVAVTKLDKINGWKTTKSPNLREALKEQSKDMSMMLMAKLEDIKYDLSKEDINAEFYFKNSNPKQIYSIVPVSSKTGEGIADLLALLVYTAQNWMLKKILYQDTVSCTIMESKYDKHNGYTIDVILNNGTINIGDKFVVSTITGPNICTIRNLLIPSALTQLGKKTNWDYKDSIRASIGCKIIGSNLDGAYPGTHLFPIKTSSVDAEADAINNANQEINAVWKSYDFISPGVFIGTQTFGELDAGYSIFQKAGINIAGAYIGEPSNKFIDLILMKTEADTLPENRIYLYFGAFNNTDVFEYAKKKDITLLSSEVIYKLVELYKIEKEKMIKARQNINNNVIFPVEMVILKQYLFMKGGSDHLMFGVKIKKGTLYKNTPICIPEKNVHLGKVLNIQFEHKEKEKGEEGQEICIRLDNPNQLIINRQFDVTDKLIAQLSRDSIDILKRDYKEIVPKKDWLLIIEHIKLLKIEK
jgi:translation initiation factor 5B